jgi:hypothetical protein
MEFVNEVKCPVMKLKSALGKDGAAKDSNYPILSEPSQLIDSTSLQTVRNARINT